MDYSQYQVKYIDNIIPNSRSLDIPTGEFQDIDVPDYGNISYLNGEALPATALILEEVAEKKPINPVKRIINTPTFKTSKGLTQFNKYFDEAIKVGGITTQQLLSRRQLLTHLAQVESGFNSSILNRTGAPAYGYFQFMQGPYKGTNYNNIGKHAGVDINTFRNSPVLQILAANSLINEFLLTLGKNNIERLHKLGWTDNAIIAGAWLGGPGNVLKYAFRGIDSSDGIDSVRKRMMKFNY